MIKTLTRIDERRGFVAGIFRGTLFYCKFAMVHREYNTWIIEIFRSGETEIEETLIAVVLNNANCTVLAVHR
jgi:hypothetical protein